LINADLVVVAQVDDLVTVRSVPWAKAGQKPPEEGKIIRVTNLGGSLGWSGKGEYLLPLKVVGEDFEVAGVAPSPGYPPPGEHMGNRLEGTPIIYPNTPAVLEQVRQIFSS
jgi:hypothetical protein